MRGRELIVAAGNGVVSEHPAIAAIVRSPLVLLYAYATPRATLA
jgi:hypothetical protein